MMHGLDLPSWTLRATIWVLAVGFPVTSVLAWVFDLSRAGVTRTPDAPVDAEGAAPPAHRRPASMAALVVASALLGAGLAFLALRGVDRQAAVAPGGRITVAVADMVNETGEKDLDVLSGLLVTSLEQSRRLAVMTQERVLDLAIRSGRKNLSRVTETLGREVGKAHGVRALLLPAIRKLGATYSLEMRVVDPGRDEHLFTLADRATSKEALLDLLDRLSEKTRRRLGEGAADVEAASVALGDAVTRSVEAYQRYAAGLEARNREGRPDLALIEFEEALRLDPEFAAAHSDLAFLLAYYGRSDLAKPHFDTAEANASRMPVKERSILRLRRAFMTPSHEGWSREEAVRAAEEILRREPGDKHALLDAARAFHVFERFDRRDTALRRALEIDPGYSAGVSFLVMVLADRTTEAMDVARRAVAVRRSPANLVELALALHATGASEEAARTAGEVLRMEGGETWAVAAGACYVLHQSGADAECIPVWERIRSSGTNPLERDGAAFQIAKSLLVRGRAREGLRALVAAEARAPGNEIQGTHLRVIGRFRTDAPAAVDAARRIPHIQVRRNFLSWLGRTEEAARVDASIPDRAAFFTGWNEVFRATQAAGDRRFDEAADLMRSFHEKVRTLNAGRWQFSQASFLAEMLLAAGRLEEAARTWPAPHACRCRDPVDYAANFPPLALYRARAMAGLGRPDEAVRELDGVLAFWKEADRDLPVLVAVKELRARLEKLPAAPGGKP
jgi:tetratricopeptide (TPR) repeat protein